MPEPQITSDKAETLLEKAGESAPTRIIKSNILQITLLVICTAYAL